MDKKTEFINKLDVLLKEYNVEIKFSVGSSSDTHGLYDEKIIISHRPDPKSFKEEDWFEVDGWGISSYEIKNLLE